MNKKKLPAVIFFATLSSLLVCGGIFALWRNHPDNIWLALIYLAIPVSLITVWLVMGIAVKPIRRRVAYLADQFNRFHDHDALAIFDPGSQISACDEELLELCNSAENLWQSVRSTSQRMELLQKIFDNSLDAIIVSELSSDHIVDCNPKGRFMLGYSREELTSQTWQNLAHSKNNNKSVDLRKQILDKGYAWSDEMILLTKSKKKIPVEVSVSPLEINDRKLLVSFLRDITDRKAAEQRISHLAYHDALTGLPNRELLNDRIQQAVFKANRTNTQGAILFLDLDKFKRINDSLGHVLGDQLLTEVALRLKQNLREEDTIARLGGDEFVVVIDGLAGYEKTVRLEIRRLAEKIHDALALPYQLAGQELQVTSSIGISIFPRDADIVDTLLRQADTAMYHAKDAGRDQITFFDIAMEEATVSRLELENQLRLAMDNGQFQVYFQPILRIDDGTPVGAEALVRWVHPEQGVITPGEFLSSLENSRLLMRIDDWVLRETIDLATRLSEHPECRCFELLSINVSSIQFHKPKYIESIRQALKNRNIPPEILQFEITEEIIVQDFDDSLLKTNQLRQLGVRIAVDHYGTGYSSMNWLKQIPLDTLKVDRSFIAGIGTESADEMVIDTTLAMARHMKLSVIAEGVESDQELEFLRKANCQYYQGYHAGLPVPAEHLIELCSASIGMDR